MNKLRIIIIIKIKRIITSNPKIGYTMRYFISNLIDIRKPSMVKLFFDNACASLKNKHVGK